MTDREAIRVALLALNHPMANGKEKEAIRVLKNILRHGAIISDDAGRSL